MQPYHPLTTLFTLAVSSAAVELGLTAYLVAAWRGGRCIYFCFLSIRISLTICRLTLLLFNALCTVFSPLIYVLWSTGGSVHLLSSLFGSAMGYAHNTRAGKGSHVQQLPVLAIPTSLAWIEFMLYVFTLIISVTWVRAARKGRGQSNLERNQRQSLYI
ncbi:hypothetical protein EI94DRAFT_1720655 [Lactarius quietus]|nr:hypothetical protein EI94DRAFT_1720655 [Lactarius quietus]